MTINEFFKYQESDDIVAMKDSCVVKAFLGELKENITGNLLHSESNFKDLFAWGNSDRLDVEKVMGDLYKSKGPNWCTALVVHYLIGATGRLNSNVDTNKMNGWLNEVNTYFKDYATKLYVQYIKEKWGQFSLGEYKSLLTSSEWRQETAAKQASGTWKSSTWEIYNHWLKLTACGAEDDTIKEIYELLTTKDPTLILPDSMKAENWKKYGAWHDGRLEDYFSVNNANGSYNYKSGAFIGGYAYDTTNTSYFATEYVLKSPLYKNPYGCCFSGDTRVLMADGSYKRMDSLQSGEEVISMNGIRKIMLVSVPYRKNRMLYSINGWNPKFTYEHPVLTYYPKSEQETLGAGFISPETAVELIPQFKEFDISEIRNGTSLYVYRNNKIEKEKIDVIQEHKEITDEYVYDIILEPDGKKYDIYFVGDERGAFAVLSELPALWKYPETTWIFVNLLSRYGKEICEKYAPISLKRWKQSGIFPCMKRAIEEKVYEKMQIKYSDEIEEISLLKVMHTEEGFSQDMGILSDLLISELSETVNDIVGNKDFKEEEKQEIMEWLVTFIGEFILGYQREI